MYEGVPGSRRHALIHTQKILVMIVMNIYRDRHLTCLKRTATYTHWHACNREVGHVHVLSRIFFGLLPLGVFFLLFRHLIFNLSYSSHALVCLLLERPFFSFFLSLFLFFYIQHFYQFIRFFPLQRFQQRQKKKTIVSIYTSC